MRSYRRTLLAAGAALALGLASPGMSPPAHAITVFDPANYSQNLLQATRALIQINNQVRQLANEAQMLINQAQDLASLPTSIATELQASFAQVDALIRDAQGIAYQVSAIETEYRRLFPEQYDDAVATSQILRDAQESWRLARGGFQHALQVQAEVVNQVRADAATLDRLIAESQAATGNLQALQAGNQLTALAAQQSMQLQVLLAASARAEALDRARAIATHEQGRARLERFLGDGNAYTPF